VLGDAWADKVQVTPKNSLDLQLLPRWCKLSMRAFNG